MSLPQMTCIKRGLPAVSDVLYVGCLRWFACKCCRLSQDHDHDWAGELSGWSLSFMQQPPATNPAIFLAPRRIVDILPSP